MKKKYEKNSFGILLHVKESKKTKKILEKKRSRYGVVWECPFRAQGESVHFGHKEIASIFRGLVRYRLAVFVILNPECEGS